MEEYRTNKCKTMVWYGMVKKKKKIWLQWHIHFDPKFFHSCHLEKASYSIPSYIWRTKSFLSLSLPIMNHKLKSPWEVQWMIKLNSTWEFIRIAWIDRLKGKRWGNWLHVVSIRFNVRFVKTNKNKEARPDLWYCAPIYLQPLTCAFQEPLFLLYSFERWWLKKRREGKANTDRPRRWLRPPAEPLPSCFCRTAGDGN